MYNTPCVYCSWCIVGYIFLSTVQYIYIKSNRVGMTVRHHFLPSPLLPAFLWASCWRHPTSERMPNVGAIGFALTVAAYLYYSLWVLLTPFVEKDVVWFHNLFPDTWWALAVPTALLVLGVTCVITFVGILGR